jgi:pilus assembly protein CpaB
LLLRPMLVPAAQVTGALAIPRGMMAVTIALCIPEAVAGNLRAGSEVAVFNTFAGHASTLTAGPNCTGPHQQQAYGSVRTQVVLSRVEVLSVGPSAASTRASNGSSVSTQNGQLVTLAVSQADAERVIGATEAGLPYLALLTSSSVTRLDNAGAQP